MESELYACVNVQVFFYSCKFVYESVLFDWSVDLWKLKAVLVHLLYNYLIQFFIFGVIFMYLVMEYMVSTKYRFEGVFLVDFQAGLYVGSNVQFSLSLVSRSINWWKKSVHGLWEELLNFSWKGFCLVDSFI